MLIIFSTIILIPTATIAQSEWFELNTTVADSSMIAFIVRSDVFFDTVSHDSVDFIRFEDISATDSVGWPEVPRITCMVALPDSVDPSVSWTAFGERGSSTLPVYPAPDDSVNHDQTPRMVEVFTQDSTAYSSGDWWPEEPVSTIGEIRLCEQRLLLMDIYPVRFLASEDSLATISTFSLSVRFDSSEAVWSDVGLGELQDAARDSRIVGYHPVEQSHAPVPTVFRDFDLQTGPTRIPDYVVLVADGLDGDPVDDLAWHRVDLNGMDVAVVTTAEVMDEFGGTAEVIDEGIIRDFTEAMWEWGQPSAKRPSHLLLIGDHETPIYGEEDWFLPTHEYDYELPSDNKLANDEWYAYFDCGPEIPDNGFPDMMVGRLSVMGADTLEEMIDNIIAMEQPITSPPLVDSRRRLVRLAGTGNDIPDTYNQTYHEWHPNAEWTRDVSAWLDYDFANAYCGDGRDWTTLDGSTYSSADYLDFTVDQFSDGAGVIFYTDHGDFHMFGAGLEWWPHFCDETKGARDSCFNCLQALSLSPNQYHSPPFVLMLCCGAGTFNHTQSLHPEGNAWTDLCLDRDPPDPPPPYDFATRCLAEAVHRNTDCPSAGVFAGAGSSLVSWYMHYGRGIIEAVYRFGESRLGEAIAGARMRYMSLNPNTTALGQFNLLGDPALDIGDRVRYPDDCDLVIAPADITALEYPRITTGGLEEDISITVRNNGGDDSGPFDVRLTVSYGVHLDTYYCESDGLEPGEEAVYSQTWTSSEFDPPGTVTISAHADPDEDCDDSWTANNDATVQRTFWDAYPLEEDWPIETSMIVKSPPMLVDMDEDSDLEMVVLSGNMLEAYDTDGSLLWRNGELTVNWTYPPLFADLDGDGEAEILAVSSGDIVAFDARGEQMGDPLSISPLHAFAVGDMDDSDGLELAVASSDVLHLYSWDPVGEEFDQLSSKDFSLSPEPNGVSRLLCTDLNDDGYGESTYYCAYVQETPEAVEYYWLISYDWISEQVLSQREYEQKPPFATPCAGILAGSAEVGFPLWEYDPLKPNSYPAQLIDPLSSATPVDCDPGNVTSYWVKFGLFADWDSGVTGLDAFVIPAENQCLAWDDGGNALSDWPVDYAGGSYDGVGVSPPALADLDGDGWADVLSSTREDENGLVQCLDRNGLVLEDLQFPFVLPEDIDVSSGFAIADIDGDEAIEVVFATSEGFLHVWELGSCDAGEAPWPQHRHDAGRSGVLE